MRKQPFSREHGSTLARPPQPGFTLIELLVVIAIIAILAAILFPVFARARENARRSNCQSNLKQIGIGILQYSQDYDERYPSFFSDGDGLIHGGTGTFYFTATATEPTLDKGWGELVQPYVKSEQIFQCPSEKFRARAAMGLAGNGEYYSDYWYYVGLTFGNGGGGKKLSQVNYPAMTIMVGEGGSKVQGSSAFTLLNGADSSGANTTPNTAIINTGELERHLEGTNFLFADGHVKWYKAESGTETSQIWDDDLRTSYTAAQDPTGVAPKVGTVPSFTL